MVLPTRVGMFRPLLLTQQPTQGSPHTRGDVPGLVELGRLHRVFSPHAWGCSVIINGQAVHVDVLPTRVGMFRRPAPNRRTATCSPHTRGDVPRSAAPNRSAAVFSPHAWGCSGDYHYTPSRGFVLPTRVGMFRMYFLKSPPSTCSPHTRGDVPYKFAHTRIARAFSPHAWGCSDIIVNRLSIIIVLPTRVGMFRRPSPTRGFSSRSPHTRGDVPLWATLAFHGRRFSPHAWGCSSDSVSGVRRALVLPTRVGMFRPVTSAGTRRKSSPHTRGDVPGLGGQT